jgi:hypothetical protein
LVVSESYASSAEPLNPHLREEVIMKFLLRTLATTAIVVLATDAGQGATASSRLATTSSRQANVGQGATASSKLATAISRLHDKKVAEAAGRLTHLQLPKGSKPQVASRNRAAQTLAAADAKKGGVAAGADAKKGGVAAAADAKKGGLAAATGALKGGVAATADAKKGGAAAAARVLAAIPAARVTPPVSAPPGLHAAAREGALSGASIKPHPSALVALGGAETGKGAAVINGASVRPKGH